jgi:hypothetical protein
VHEVLGLGVLVTAWAGCYLIRPSGSQPFSHFAFACPLRNYTKHEIPLAKLHETRDSPCEISRNTKFPAKLHKTRDSPRNCTKHEIPPAKLHETPDSPRKITRNTRFFAKLYETRDSSCEITRNARSLWGYSVPVSHNYICEMSWKVCIHIARI